MRFLPALCCASTLAFADVSARAATQLEMVGAGVAPVSVEVVDAEVLADAAEFHLQEGCEACEALP